MNGLAESHYVSAQRETLGKSSMKRNCNFPEAVESSDFRFIVPATGISNANDIIYNGNINYVSEEVINLY